jgi:hypothetical protein
VIGVLTIIEGINDGFTFLNWVVVAVSVVFALQAVWTLARDRSSQPDPTNRVGRIGKCRSRRASWADALALIDRIPTNQRCPAWPTRDASTTGSPAKP